MTSGIVTRPLHVGAGGADGVRRDVHLRLVVGDGHGGAGLAGEQGSELGAAAGARPVQLVLDAGAAAGAVERHSPSSRVHRPPTGLVPFRSTTRLPYTTTMSFEVVLQDNRVERVDGADAFAPEGPMTSFFVLGEGRRTIDVWSTRVASVRTSSILLVRRAGSER